MFILFVSFLHSVQPMEINALGQMDVNISGVFPTSLRSQGLRQTDALRPVRVAFVFQISEATATLLQAF
jgi:hypothetical protein